MVGALRENWVVDCSTIQQFKAGYVCALSIGAGVVAAAGIVPILDDGGFVRHGNPQIDQITFDAVIAGVNLVEDDPNDHSVGYGGLANEDGIVVLDAAVMHGPTHRGGAVASLRNIKNPSRVARLVMERTDHVLLVGEGALRFARAHGFKEEDLLTDEAREIWLRWKENMSTKDDRLGPHTPETPEKEIGEALFPRPGIPGVDPETMKSYDAFFRLSGTIHCSAIDREGSLSCVIHDKLPTMLPSSPFVARPSQSSSATPRVTRGVNMAGDVP